MRAIDADVLARELLSLTNLSCDGGYYKGRADERDDILQRIADAPTIAIPEARALTLDELREMDGMPIYTKTIGVIGSGRWELIAFDDHWIHLKTAREHYKMTREELSGSYGKTWVAYDRQPKGARNNETA